MTREVIVTKNGISALYSEPVDICNYMNDVFVHIGWTTSTSIHLDDNELPLETFLGNNVNS